MNECVNKIMHTKRIYNTNYMHRRQYHEHIDYAISKIEEQHKNLEQHGYATVRQIRTLKKELDPLIISECGKGKGILHLCCPIKWDEHTNKNLYSDEEHFKKENITPKEVMKKFRDQYGIGGWDRISKLFNKQARVPYLLPGP